MRALAPQLDPSDIESTTMGLSGVDVVLTKAARDVFGPLAFECKNVEKLNAVGVFQGHYDKYAPKGQVPIMVHSRNHIEPRVTMLWSDFVRLYLKPSLTVRPGVERVSPFETDAQVKARVYGGKVNACHVKSTGFDADQGWEE